MFFVPIYKRGFTLIELLVVVGIVALLLIAFTANGLSQLSKSRDSTRKSDLHEIKLAFEQYYNDRGEFPASGILSNCGEAFFDYLKTIPCDPKDESPYIYDPTAGLDSFRVLARLENENDPVIEELFCDGGTGCGYPNEPNYNYGVSSGRRVSDTTGSSSSPPPGNSPLPEICGGSYEPTKCEYSGGNYGTCQDCGGEECNLGPNETQYACHIDCTQNSPCAGNVIQL